MSALEPLGRLQTGTKLLVGGQHLFTVGPELAERFHPGDVLRFVEATGEVLHIPAAEQTIATEAVARAVAAFELIGQVTATQIAAFYDGFAARLEDDTVWAAVTRANAEDVAVAKARGPLSTTRLEVSDKNASRHGFRVTGVGGDDLSSRADSRNGRTRRVEGRTRRRGNWA